MKIKTGDKVRIRSGKDKGKEGVVLQVFPQHERVVVEGLNMAKRHLRRGGGHQGQAIDFPAPMHVSNVQIVSQKTGSTGRVGFKFIEKEGKRMKIRILKGKGKQEDLE